MVCYTHCLGNNDKKERFVHAPLQIECFASIFDPGLVESADEEPVDEEMTAYDPS